MKGFLKRDIYMIWPNLRFYGLFMLLLIGLTIFRVSDMSGFFGFYMTLFGASSILGLFSYDEMNHWQAYAAAIPDGRRRLVDGRYITALLVGGMVMASIALAIALSRAFGNMSMVLLYGGVFLVYMDLALPVGYRFGNNSRVVLVVLIGAMAAVAGAGGAILSISIGVGSDSGLILTAGLPLLAVGLLGMPVSRGVSLKIMEKKKL